MQFLSSSGAIQSVIARHLRSASRIWIASAWAGYDFPTCDLLNRRRSAIVCMVIGTEFYQTNPDFLECFRTCNRVRFVMQSEELFHPKLYLFEKPNKEWAAVVGSANFTESGMSSNVEAAIIIESKDVGSAEIKSAIQSEFTRYWNLGRSISSREVEHYRLLWKNRHASLESMSHGKIIRHKKRRGGKNRDGGKDVFESHICSMPWKKFIAKVTSGGSRSQAIRQSLAVVGEARDLFEKYKHFNAMKDLDRQKIAGLWTDPNGIDYKWLGSMFGAGWFKREIGSNSHAISAALDEIPQEGSVTRHHYRSYIRCMIMGISKGLGIATASRLLAMKRPDYFICLNRPNKRMLCNDFGISRNIGYDSYWDSIIERVLDSRWWNEPRPSRKSERDVWMARTALLDILYYNERDRV